MSIKKEKFKVYGMTCNSCENRIEKIIKKLDGILNAKANYSEEFVEVEYDSDLCNQNKIKTAIKNAGYSTQNTNDYKFFGIIILVAIIILLGFQTSGFDMESKLTNTSYAILFIVGILTSIHCVGMCGGIMISQSLSKESKNKFETIKPSLLYNLGRVISYTILGGIIGAFGSVFSLSITVKSGIQIFAGIFMIMMGFNMAGFKIFKKFNITLPINICKIKNNSRSSFIVGVLNGLMPCGPLQTMQLYALGTGSATKGALSMFMFSIGTVPLMLLFGALSGFLTKGYTKRILKFSGVLIIILGLIMGNRGLTLAGININPLSMFHNNDKYLSASASNSNVSKATIQNGVQIIKMTADNNGYTPNAFYVQKGIPVKWIIDGKEINSCNNAIVIQSLNIEKRLQQGENIIQFTPKDKDINFSCWMGMIGGVIKVVNRLDSVDTSNPDSSLPPPSSGPSCCATPVADNSNEPTQKSIYGSDLTKAPTETLVNKALIIGKYQSVKFKGIENEFKPLVIVSADNLKTKLILDLTNFNNPEGEYIIADITTGNKITSFNGKNGINEIDFNSPKTGGYVILKDNAPLGLLEVVDDTTTIDIEKIREKYIQ